ncbi:MAG: hypothetical protein HYS09_04835 [Chloroflexi bacterium]|nr:hypothetical protein [Chloroflexota bacterium]
MWQRVVTAAIGVPLLVGGLVVMTLVDISFASDPDEWTVRWGGPTVYSFIFGGPAALLGLPFTLATLAPSRTLRRLVVALGTGLLAVAAAFGAAVLLPEHLGQGGDPRGSGAAAMTVAFLVAAYLGYRLAR